MDLNRSATGNVLVAAFLVVVLVVGCTPVLPAHAAPQLPALPAAVTETAKVTLPETSIAGPGFTFTDIAWTGTDAAHHLNTRIGTDGLHFPTKTTLPETSPNGPAIIEQVDTASTANVILAWTGSDANHSLNMQVFPGGQKLTLHESSLGTPAFQFIGNPNGTPNTVILAWTGIDANHSLNVIPIGISNPLTPGKKTVLRQFSSDAGPSLAGTGTGLVLGWSTRATQQLNLATSTDGVHFTSALGSGLPQTSATAPQLSGDCIAWTGTDAAHHLNVQCTTQFPQFPDPAHTKTVLPETALGAPGFTKTTNTNGGEIAWTGTDLAHHLNVAQFQGF